MTNVISEKSGIRVAIGTQGCKLNQAESDGLANRFSEAGYTLVDPEQTAEVYVLNTCSVTHVADSKARQWLRSAKRRNPEALVVATGCYANRASATLVAMQEVDLVIGNRNKDVLLDSLQVSGLLEKYGSYPAAPGHDSVSDRRYSQRTRAFVKIQDGCNQFCSFCIVPITRGRQLDVPIADVVERVSNRVREGYKEVVLTGPQIGSYGLYPPTAESRKDPEGYDCRLHGLMEAILEQTNVDRLRLSSIQPQDLTPRLLSAWKDPRVCRHVHMALQSGCDSTLRRMKRRYSTYQFEKAANMLREEVPDIAVTTDVIVGFPGETEDEFEESYQFCRRIGFADMHVFPYSARPTTQAERLENKTPPKVKKERVAKMLALAQDSASRFRRSFIGRRMDVLWEEGQSIDNDTFIVGLTDNYIKAYTLDSEVRPNSITPVTLLDEMGKGLIGSVSNLRRSMFAVA